LSFLVQLRLSKTLKTKYDSLYEGQVVGRIDSPAHRAEQVELALHLVERGSVALPAEVTHLRLAALLGSGVALDLPGGERLTAGALRPESHWAGKSIQAADINKTIPSAKITAILRGTSVVFPRPQTVLQPGDRLLIIAPHTAQEALNENLASPSAVRQKEEAKNDEG
jgi:Trk K+ transport system NAD-binding subunit